MTRAPLIPRDVLFGNPTYASPRISPDGTRLAYLAPDEGVLNVWLCPADDPTAARPVTADRLRGVRTFGFCHDDRTLFYLQDSGGDENWRLHLLDLESGVEECVTDFADVQVSVLEHNRWHPTTMVLQMNKDNPQLFDLWRLDLTDRSLTKVRENPGGLMGWKVDTDLTVRGGTAMTPDGGGVEYLADPETGELTEWLTIPPEDVTGTGVVGFERGQDRLFAFSSVGTNASRLLAVDIATGTETELAADPHYDVGGLQMHPVTNVPQAVTFTKDREEWVFLDREFEAAVTRLRADLVAIGAPDGELTINRNERTDRLWTVAVLPADGPVHFYLYDRGATTGSGDASGVLTLLFVHKPELSEYRLAPMEPFSFTARDGLTIHGYLTFPLDVEWRDLPAVLDVHGGPWARDLWGFNPEAQWLANRGYLCVQVNFRGSVGYGKEFLNAGAKQWGKSMHTDLLDAVDHLIERGLVDRDRVGISGGSYGGYAALAGAAFSPEVFRCAIDLCGPSNLLTLLASIPPYWAPMKALFTSKVGDPDTERDMLWERSPLSAVENIRIPVLVAQGANDPRVKQAEAEQIVEALQKNGLPHEYLLFEDEGHGLARPENRMVYYAATEKFLAEHLGGRREE